MSSLLSQPQDTVAFGKAYAEGLTKGDVLLLFGPLGAGKTTLVTGLAEGLGVTSHVVSPTYTLLEVYEGRLPVYHFDFYRLEGPRELRTLDPREYFEAGVSIIEWPERIEALWPLDFHEIRLSFDPEGRRVECVRHRITVP